MKMKKHFSILLNAALSAVLAIGLSACSEDFNLTNDNNEPNPDKPVNFDDYPTRFGTGDIVAEAKAMLSGPLKISTDYNMKWYWTYGDSIWVDTVRVRAGKSGSYWVRDDANDIPKTGQQAWANFYMGCVLKGDHYEVRYTGNDFNGTAGTGNGTKADEVTIAATQIQSAPGSSVHLGKYGDCGVDTSAHEGDKSGYHKFNLNHKAAYAIFTPRLDSIEQKDSFALTIGNIPLKSITFTKTDATGQICGTYPFRQVGNVVKLDTANATNRGKTIKLETTDGILGKTKDENKAYYMVLQPGQHNFTVSYEFEYPEYIGNKDGGTGTKYETAKATRVLSKSGGYKFSENGFTKVNHNIEIPAYREKYTYYTWGASANYHSDSIYKDAKRTDSYPLLNPKTQRHNLWAPSYNNSTYTSTFTQNDVWIGYNRGTFFHGELTEKSDVRTPFFMPLAKSNINVYSLMPQMPLWKARSSDTKAAFYGWNSDDASATGEAMNELPFLTAANKDTKYVYAITTGDTIQYKKNRNNDNSTTTLEEGKIIPVEHLRDRKFHELYRSIRRMPSANEMTWYMTQDFYVDTISPWLAADKKISNSDGRYPLVRGGVWFKKSNRTASGFGSNQLETSKDLSKDSPADAAKYKITADNTHFHYGTPPAAQKSQYFFVPFLGYYHTDADSTNVNAMKVELKYYGTRGYYWTRTQHLTDYYRAYYLVITKDYIQLTSEGSENKKHGMVGNERPDWCRILNVGVDNSDNKVMLNDWWFQ